MAFIAFSSSNIGTLLVMIFSIWFNQPSKQVIFSWRSQTLIELIPKIDPPSTYKDFRSISLCNIIYNIITKVLVHRLRPILTFIIGPYQSSFQPSMGTSDNSIVLHKIIHFMRRSKR